MQCSQLAKAIRSWLTFIVRTTLSTAMILDIRNATGWHGVTAAAMEDCGASRATVAMPYKVVHGASDVAVGQRGYS
jgi:hypothetical protein